MRQKALVDMLVEAERYFTRDIYIESVRSARTAFLQRDYLKARKILASLPNEQQLFEELLEKLKGKSVYKTLKAVIEKKTTTKFTDLKGLFSLGTHVAIECERGNNEYALLLSRLYNEIGSKLFGK